MELKKVEKIIKEQSEDLLVDDTYSAISPVAMSKSSPNSSPKKQLKKVLKAVSAFDMQSLSINN